jgi:hypothetical protein
MRRQTGNETVNHVSEQPSAMSPGRTLVPAIRHGTLPLPMAGTSPAMTVRAIPVSSKAGRPAAGAELAMTVGGDRSTA